MKLDTAEPKDWPKFIKDLGLIGLENLLMKHCAVAFWAFPSIVLVLEPAQQPCISAALVESIREKIENYYECNKIDLKIILRVEGKDPYAYSGYVDKLKDEKLKEISKRIELKKMSEQSYVSICPFHNEKTPSFSVNMPLSFYHCFGCGVHGALEDFPKRFDEFSAVKNKEKKDNRAKCIKHLKHARIRCQEIMNSIDYQIVNYDHPHDDLIEIFEIRYNLDQLNEDIECAEDIKF